VPLIVAVPVGASGAHADNDPAASAAIAAAPTTLPATHGSKRPCMGYNVHDVRRGRRRHPRRDGREVAAERCISQERLRLGMRSPADSCGPARYASRSFLRNERGEGEPG
jgi:hypothetical protein